MSKRVKILFTISVVLNVLFVGLIAGHAVHKYKLRHWPGNLSDEGREVVRNVMREKFKEFAPLRVNLMKKKREMYKILAADEFDPLAYDALVQNIAALQSEYEQHKAEAMKGVVAGLTDEERKEFARVMAEKISGREKRWREWKERRTD